VVKDLGDNRFSLQNGADVHRTTDRNPISEPDTFLIMSDLVTDIVTRPEARPLTDAAGGRRGLR
jgi:hypothetical protein